MTPAPLPPEALRRRSDVARLTFTTTEELVDGHQLLGQERARSALEFGVGIRQEGYNLFVIGSPGVGRRTLVEHLLEHAPPIGAAPQDWCYVNNFADHQRPVAIGLPAGRGEALRRDVAQWIDELRDAIPAAFDTDEYRDRLGRIDAEFNERQQHSFEDIGTRASAEGIALLRTPTGFSFAPLSGHEVMTPEEFGKLPSERQHELAERMRHYETELEGVVRQVLVWRRERAESLKALNAEVVEYAVGRITAELRARYEDLPAVAAHLDAARADVIAHVDDFRRTAEQQQPVEVAGMLVKAEPDFARYQVNLLVGHCVDCPPPVIFEDNPTYANLVGRVEHLAQFGALTTNFGLIRAGALHRANGGYLLVDAMRLLQQPYAWEGLKRALRGNEIRIDSLGQMFSLVSTISLEPQAIPLRVKVVLFGPPQLYPMLEAYDPDFGALFKVAAEFAEDVPWTDDTTEALARLVAAIARRRALRPFGRAAVGAVAEECARMAGDATRLSANVREIEELLQEADYWAQKAGNDTVTAADVERAAHERIERSALTRERVQQAVLRDLIMIDTTGAKTGQVNGLAVYSLGRATFALPQRITATTRNGKGDVVDIHREIALSGAIHSKGVLTLSAFLATRFGRRRGLSLSATLAFEQTYSAIDGDSATAAELCALLSSLSGVPIRQDMAITGSMNQHGEVQAIGGVNDKIEGFFELCRARGLTGTQGVVIPQANRQHLMLRPDVVEAVRAGRFHIHAITHVDEAIELLTGLPAGAEDSGGGFPRDSVNGRAAARLVQYEIDALPRPPAGRAIRAHRRNA
ncbi:MAG: ATP-binding protein [Burkholderiaceae bacterium]|nr:MAG: ATP-binding protein [Burkholderiaceae bacterium]